MRGVTERNAGDYPLGTLRGAGRRDWAMADCGGGRIAVKWRAAVSSFPSDAKEHARHGPATPHRPRQRHPRGARHLRTDRGAGPAPVGRADAAFADQLRHLGRAPAPGDRARAGAGQAGVGQGQPRPGAVAGGQDSRHRRGGRRGARRPARRGVSAGRVADRLGHADQHEHERGAGQPGQRTAGRRARRGAPGASERRREQEPVEQRRVPHGDARGGGAGDRASAAAGAR